jgi:hypothetical protein
VITTLVTAAIWTTASLVLALIAGAVIALRDSDCCPHEVDVPDTVPVEWVTA